MIQLVDRALEEFLREQVPLRVNAVDLSFQAPDKSWGSALTRPTLNVFLWDVSGHVGYLKTGMEQRVNPDGKIERRPTNPVVDLSYLVTSWATERRDEHELLGSVLECIMSHRAIPEEFLPERFSGARCGISLASADRRVPGDFWSALDGRLKAGLQLQVTLPVEVFAWQSTASPTEQVELTVDRTPVSGAATRSRKPGASRPRPEPEQDPRADAQVAETTRRRRNGAMVMEAKGPRRPEPDAEP